VRNDVVYDHDDCVCAVVVALLVAAVVWVHMVAAGFVDAADRLAHVALKCSAAADVVSPQEIVLPRAFSGPQHVAYLLLSLLDEFSAVIPARASLPTKISTSTINKPNRACISFSRSSIDLGPINCTLYLDLLQNGHLQVQLHGCQHKITQNMMLICSKHTIL